MSDNEHTYNSTDYIISINCCSKFKFQLNHILLTKVHLSFSGEIYKEKARNSTKT